jgi:hypothetical protein
MTKKQGTESEDRDAKLDRILDLLERFLALRYVEEGGGDEEYNLRLISHSTTRVERECRPNPVRVADTSDLQREIGQEFAELASMFLGQSIIVGQKAKTS